MSVALTCVQSIRLDLVSDIYDRQRAYEEEDWPASIQEDPRVPTD